MNGDEFAQYLLQQSQQVENFTNNDAPVVMGKTAVDFFKEGFQNEGFTDNGLEKWEEVKRRLNPKVTGAKTSRAILTGDTANLGESINYKNASNGEVTVHSDLPYAEAHNEGTTTAGRSRNVTIPKRKFIGDSEHLNNLITDELERKLDIIIKQP